MPASRWSRPTITRRCTALTCCGNRNPASRASDVDEASRRLSGRHGGGDLGPWLRGGPAGARRTLARADDGDALFDRGGAVPVRAPPECFLDGADRDQRHAVSWTVSVAVMGDRARCAGWPCARCRAEPGAVHGGICSSGVSRNSDARANRRDCCRSGRPVDDLRHRRLRFQRRRLRPADHFTGQFCNRQSVAAAGEGRSDVRPVRMALPGAAAAAVGAGAGRGWTAGDLALAVAECLCRLGQMSLTGWASMVFGGAISTSIAYWLWGRLLRDHTAAQVVPFALLVPFVGAAASSIVFGERFGPLPLAGMVTVVCGIAIMLLLGRPRSVPKIA